MGKPTLLPMIKEKEDKRWDWTSNPVIPQTHANVCSHIKCGRMFSEPLALTVRVDGSLETYQACPHCFSRLGISETLEKDLSETPLSASEEALSNAADEVANCAHFLGYLKTRPKDSPIPDECLTCNQILKCM